MKENEKVYSSKELQGIFDKTDAKAQFVLDLNEARNERAEEIRNKMRVTDVEDGMLSESIAEHILGYVRRKSHVDKGMLGWGEPDGKGFYSRFNPQTDMSHAWHVIEKLKQKGHRVILKADIENGYECIIQSVNNSDELYQAREKSMPAAITMCVGKYLNEIK